MLIEIIQKNTVATSIHAIFRKIRLPVAGSVAIRMSETRWVRGKIARAMYWKITGSIVSGKNVPENNIIGVISRNEG